MISYQISLIHIHLHILRSYISFPGCQLDKFQRNRTKNSGVYQYYCPSDGKNYKSPKKQQDRYSMYNALA